MKKVKNPLSNLVLKARKKQKITVAFFGGSITWGGNSTDIETKSYRALVGQWFKKQFPGCRVECVNAGFGGTGSVPGAYRFDEQVLSHKPDLIFTEFSINDSKTHQILMQSAHEAFFRKAWKKNPKTGFIMLISGSRDDRQAVLTTEKIGEDFGINVIDIGAYKRKLIQKGRATDEELWTDDVHPTDHGHKVYADVVTRELWKLKSRPRGSVSFSAPKNLVYWRAKEFVNARLVPAVKCKTRGTGWKLREDHHKKFDGVYPDVSTWPDRSDWPFPYRKGLMCTKKPGDSITYTGRMTRVGAAVDYVKGKCKFEVLLDGKVIAAIEHTQKKNRFPRVPEFAERLDGKKHTVKLVLKQGSLYIGYLMVS